MIAYAWRMDVDVELGNECDGDISVNDYESYSEDSMIGDSFSDDSDSKNE